MQDITLTCQTCKEEFEWSASEQEFYKKNGLMQPKRCINCRHNKRAKYNEVKQSFLDKCSKCGTNIEVKFQPIPGKPLYCHKHYQEWIESKLGQPTESSNNI